MEILAEPGIFTVSCFQQQRWQVYSTFASYLYLRQIDSKFGCWLPSSSACTFLWCRMPTRLGMAWRWKTSAVLVIGPCIFFFSFLFLSKVFAKMFPPLFAFTLHIISVWVFWIHFNSTVWETIKVDAQWEQSSAVKQAARSVREKAGYAPRASIVPQAWVFCWCFFGVILPSLKLT